MEFQGKVALITGGNSGIGRAAALAFALEGARVMIAARNRERGDAVVREIRENGGEALFVPTDVSKPVEIAALLRRTVETWGRIDCAFNNAAGYSGAFSLTADFSEEEFDETIAVDLKGVWIAMKHEIRQMLAQNPPGGSIVNTSSVNGLGGIATGAIFSAAKAGVIALTKSAAQEYARRGIRVNVLVPGAFLARCSNTAWIAPRTATPSEGGRSNSAIRRLRLPDASPILSKPPKLSFGCAHRRPLTFTATH